MGVGGRRRSRDGRPEATGGKTRDAELEQIDSLRAELRSLEEYFASADDACTPGLVPTFACGEDGAVTCITHREVCYLDGHGQPPRCAAPPPESDCTGTLSCECVGYHSFTEICREEAPGEVTVVHTGP